MTVLEIPWQQLSAEALQGVLEAFALREGTEYGAVDISLDAKVAQLRRQLECGEAKIYFDSARGDCELLTPQQARRAADPENARA